MACSDLPHTIQTCSVVSFITSEGGGARTPAARPRSAVEGSADLQGDVAFEHHRSVSSDLDCARRDPPPQIRKRLHSRCSNTITGSCKACSSM